MPVGQESPWRGTGVWAVDVMESVSSAMNIMNLIILDFLYSCRMAQGNDEFDSESRVKWGRMCFKKRSHQEIDRGTSVPPNVLLYSCLFVAIFQRTPDIIKHWRVTKWLQQRKKHL